MGNMTPIETEYKGYRFRSKLEARWAVFFDAIGIHYEYEPEGFKLPSGTWYEPDFKLSGFCGRGPLYWTDPGILWCEVKGVEDEHDLMERKSDDYKKVAEFSNSDPLDYLCYRKCYLNEDISDESIEYARSLLNRIIILPNIPLDCGEWWDSSVTNFEFVDGDYWPCIITKRDVYEKRFVLCGPDGDSYPTQDEIYLTNEALKRARSVRFDHGEHGEFEPIKISYDQWRL